MPITEDARRRAQELIDDCTLVVNSLHDVATVGWSPAVDARRWAHDNEAHLRAALEKLSALLTGSGVSPQGKEE